MNRRRFFARAAAIGAGILASCSPRLVGLAQAQERLAGHPRLLKLQVAEPESFVAAPIWIDSKTVPGGIYGRVIDFDRVEGTITVEWPSR